MKKLAAAALILLLAGLIHLSALSEAEDITGKCGFHLSEGYPRPILDRSVITGWQPSGDPAEVRVDFPEDAGYFCIDWMTEPINFCFAQYDGCGNVLSESSQDNFLVSLCQVFVLDPDTESACLRFSQPNQAILEACVFSRGELPKDVKNFMPAYEKCDLMVVSAHQDDEWIFFGGIIPYYEHVMDKRVQVVYMADCGRYRREEALDGLWASGMRTLPEFINLEDENITSIDTALENWGGHDGLAAVLAERIRRFQPEVILTHDIAGEYGHIQHILTAWFMKTAIEAAADPSFHPESSEKYGAWQVKKLYLHLAANSIDFDWNICYEELGGYTPLEVAYIAYEKHQSQHRFYQVVDGGTYDNSRFGLTYTTVGMDVLRNDLFENIPLQEREKTVFPAKALSLPDKQIGSGN